jgi:hypothetical protein
MNNCIIFDGVAILSPSVTVRYVLLKRFGRVSVSCTTAAKFQPHRPSYTAFVQNGNVIFGKFYEDSLLLRAHACAEVSKL